MKIVTDPFQPRIWKMAHGRSLELGPNSQIMGILNATPDSFSDGGRFIDISDAMDQVARMVDDGAKIIDVGGESTKPGAITVTLDEEQQRVIPIIEAVAQRFDIAISIDTYRHATAKLALEGGAHIVNDVTGLQQVGEDDRIRMAQLVSKFSAGICLMHNSRNRDVADDLIDDQFGYLKKSLQNAKDFGVTDDQIVLDPGFGFGKSADENLNLLSNFERLFALDYPWLCGTSRKRFIGSSIGVADNELHRDIGTAATNVVARTKGVGLFRVHDIAVNKAALNLADAIIAAR